MIKMRNLVHSNNSCTVCNMFGKVFNTIITYRPWFKSSIVILYEKFKLYNTKDDGSESQVMTELEESFKKHTTLKNTGCPASTLEGSRQAIMGSVRALVTGGTLQACEDRDTCICSQMAQTNTIIPPTTTKKIGANFLPGLHWQLGKN